MGRENKFKFIFSRPLKKMKENIFQAMTGCLAHFPIGMPLWGVIFISNKKMTLGTEKGEASNNIVTIYPIQSNYCANSNVSLNLQ